MCAVRVFYTHLKLFAAVVSIFFVHASNNDGSVNDNADERAEGFECKPSRYAYKTSRGMCDAYRFIQLLFPSTCAMRQQH